MPTHNLTDNRKEKLVDHINRILSSTESARFAIGYFFLSGLESIAQRLAGVKELRLLIGNTTTFDDGIDQHVYALYGLTPEEIKIVEAASK